MMLIDNLASELDALVAYVRVLGPGYHLRNIALLLTAERAFYRGAVHLQPIHLFIGGHFGGCFIAGRFAGFSGKQNSSPTSQRPSNSAQN